MMQYRTLGRTGIRVSEIGMGCEGMLEKPYETVLEYVNAMERLGVNCMYCSHCEPCPQFIDIAFVTKFLHLAKAQGEIPETVREHYGALEHHAGECIACGACETRCPFGVKIARRMAQAAELLG